MTRKLGTILITAFVAFGISCAKNKKVDDGEGTDGASDGGATISSTPLDFDSTGSDSGNIAGLTTVNFAYDSSALNSSARQDLSQNAKWIKSNSNTAVQIEGHCDSRGSVEYNLALGERRAQVVRDYLVSLGVDSSRLSVISYGKEKPLVLGDTEAVHSRNRRANFVPISN